MNQRISLRTLLILVTLACLLVALFAPTSFTFELREHARTSAKIGDWIDIQDSELRKIVSNTEIVGYERINADQERIDIVTVKIPLFHRLRLLPYNEFTACYRSR